MPGAGPTISAGLAAVGAAEGALLGGFIGSMTHAHFDDDVAQAIDIADGEEGALVVVRTGGGANSEKATARTALRGAGAIAFLDATCYDELELERGRLVLVSSSAPPNPEQADRPA
jgi:hypothetical protein